MFIARDSLKRLESNFRNVLIRYPNLPNTRSTESYLKVNLDKINSCLSKLQFYLGKNSRVKRELLDGFSSVLKWLIGTPDAKDAIRFNDCINKLEKQELNSLNLMEQQVQITSSTIKNFNQTITKISYDEQIINEDIKRLGNYLNKTGKLLSDLKTNEEIASTSIQILEIVSSLEQEINDCINSILFIKSGTIHPSIITLEQLHNELLLSNHLRTNKRLVTSISLDNIHVILESATISAYVYSDRLVYILEFPLIEGNIFNLYHLYSIPIKHPNSSPFHSTIIPEYTYLATSTNGQQYITTNDLQNCKQYKSTEMVCSNVILHNTANHPMCEVEILYSTSTEMPKSCIPTTFPADINLFQPLGNNNWLYILNKGTPSVLQCNTKSEHYLLQETGILTLQPNCKLFTENMILIAHATETTNVSYPATLPRIQIDDCLMDTDFPEQPDLIPIQLNSIPLDSLNMIQNKIEKFNDQLKTLKKQTFMERNQSTFSWFTFIVITTIIIYILYKRCWPSWIWLFCKQRNNTDTTNQGGCINIFNNCYDNSSRRRNTRTEVPMVTMATQQSSATSISEDEDSDVISPTIHIQKLGTSPQSLF